MTASTYYRFFIPELFKNYNRVLYLDCDLIVDADISELADISFSHKDGEALAIACVDPYIKGIISGEVISEVPKNYFKDTLHIAYPEHYVNAGVMLYNIQEMNKHNITEKLFQALKDIPKPYFQDQDILNSVLHLNGEGVKLIHNQYNDIGRKHLTRIGFIQKFIRDLLGLAQKSNYIIYHFVSSNKPWKHRRINYRLFYYYAIYSPFYKDILKENNTKFWF